MTVHVLDISLSCFVVLCLYPWCVICVVLCLYPWCVMCVVLCLYPWCVICVVLIIRLLIELLTLLLLYVFYHTANNDINWTCLIQCFENKIIQTCFKTHLY
jgi:hypothetical protein